MTQAISSALLHFVWQGALVVFMLWVVLAFLRDRSANARYIASCSALALMAILPVITAFVLYQRPVALTAAEILAVVPSIATAASPRIDQWLLPGWSLGVLLFSLRLLWGCGQVSVIRRRGQPADASIVATVAAVAARMGLARPVRVLISAVANGPSAIGWIRPVVLLPAATVLGLTPEQLEAVLAHELAHIRRHDYLVNIIQMLIETVLFYHPAVWWTSARIRHERELCCDDAAVACCGDALCYARALTTLERLRLTTPSLAVASTGGSMLYRIERLVGVAKYRSAPSRWSGVLAICLGLAVFAGNSNWAQGQARPKIVQDEPGVKTDLGKSIVIDRTPVEYPEAAIEKNVQGTVVVETTLDKTGAVNDARVVSGPQELRKAALQSVLEWHFTPESGAEKRRVSISFQTPPPPERVEGKLLKDETVQQTDREIADLEKQLEVLRRRYTDRHPDVQSVKAELEAARRELEAQVSNPSADPATDSTRQEIERLASQLREAQGNDADASERVADLRANLEAAERAAAVAAAGGNGDREARDRQMQGTLQFLKENLSRAIDERKAMQAREADLQSVLSERLARQQKLEEDSRSQRSYALAAQRDAAITQEGLQQLKAQIQAVLAQMDELKGTAAALREQMQEQQKSQQK